MVTLRDFFRRIKYLTQKKEKTLKENHELAFYRGASEVLCKLLSADGELMLEINLHSCPLEEAKAYAQGMGLHLVEGTSGIVYLNWPDKLGG